jgi:hypothetical protein
MEGGTVNEDRFVVVGVTGWSIKQNTGRITTQYAAGTSYSVLDTVACCREVGKFYADGRPGYVRKREAEHLCAELNALEAEYEAMHGG